MSTQQPQPPPPPLPLWQRVHSILRSQVDWVAIFQILAAVVVIGVAAWVVVSPATLVEKLERPAFARGLITLIVTITTVMIALILVISSLAGQPQADDDDRFRRAREVFGALAGVLGTIIGFYFGSTTDRSKLNLGAPLVVAKGSTTEVTARISGGQPPYLFSLNSGKTALAAGRSDDGWIVASVPSSQGGQTLSLDVSDRSGDTSSVTLSTPTAPKSPPGPPAATPSPGSAAPKETEGAGGASPPAAGGKED